MIPVEKAKDMRLCDYDKLLIHEVRREKCIWNDLWDADDALEAWRIAGQKKEAWKKIALKLGFEEAEAAAGRWAELVKCFEGFYEDVQRRPDSSTGTLWTHYEDMLFLKNVN